MKQYILSIIFFFSICSNSLLSQQYSWRYYNTGNTGIQGDYVEGIWIDHDGDPYIAGYTPGWEEGGFAKFIQSENRWINYSNVDYPVIGSINDVGSSRISDIEEDANGILWMATWRGILKFDPAVGGSSLEFWGSNNSVHPRGRTKNLVIAPDASIWDEIRHMTLWIESLFVKGYLEFKDYGEPEWTRYAVFGQIADGRLRLHVDSDDISSPDRQWFWYIKSDGAFTPGQQVWTGSMYAEAPWIDYVTQQITFTATLVP